MQLLFRLLFTLGEMQPKTWRVKSILNVALAIAISSVALAQNQITFKARLSPVALDTVPPQLEMERARLR
jgi:hypothetical protein